MAKVDKIESKDKVQVSEKTKKNSVRVFQLNCEQKETIENH